VSGCSVAGTDFLLVGCSGGTAAAAEITASGIAVDANVNADADALEGDCA
jgi:hypothetical protein